jgi:hypothetical protein
MGEVPTSYRCFKCHQPGHWIKNCPLGLNQVMVSVMLSCQPSLVGFEVLTAMVMKSPAFT